MAGPEQRKMEEKRRRQEALQKLRKIYGEREKKKSAGSSPESSVNTKKDDTSKAAGFLTPPPVHFTTGHSMQSNKDGQMHIHKDPSGSASLKRKAVDSGDVSESEGKPSDGHRTKKAKPTGGYVPSAGRPYKGTMRENPSPRQPGKARALTNKSTNAPRKHSDIVSEHDTKNIYRNVPKSNLPYGGTSRPSQGQSKLAEPVATDEVVVGPPKQAKRDAPRVVASDSMDNIRHGPRQASKRKAGRDQGHATKKPKIGPTDLPQARKAGGFMKSIQLPGYTAALPTNIKHVVEIVRKPVAPRSRK